MSRVAIRTPQGLKGRCFRTESVVAYCSLAFAVTACAVARLQGPRIAVSAILCNLLPKVQERATQNVTGAQAGSNPPGVKRMTRNWPTASFEGLHQNQRLETKLS